MATAAIEETTPAGLAAVEDTEAAEAPTLQSQPKLLQNIDIGVEEKAIKETTPAEPAAAADTIDAPSDTIPASAPIVADAGPKGESSTSPKNFSEKEMKKKKKMMKQPLVLPAEATAAAPPAETKVKKSKGTYTAQMRRIKIVHNVTNFKKVDPIIFILSHRDTSIEKILARVTKQLKLWKPCTSLHTIGGEDVVDPFAFVNGEIYIATTEGEALKKPAAGRVAAVKRKRVRKLAPTSNDPSSPQTKGEPLKTPPKIPPIGSAAADSGADIAAAPAEPSISPTRVAKKMKKTTTTTTTKRVKKAGGYGTGTSTTTRTTTTTSTNTKAKATATTTSRSQGKSPMKSQRAGGGGGGGRKQAVQKKGAAAVGAAGAAVAKNSGILKRTAFKSLAMEIQLTHSDEASASVAWSEAVPSQDGGMLGSRDFITFVSGRFPLLQNRSILALAFQHTCEMQAKESPLLSGKFRIGARFFAPLLLHAVHFAEAFMILGVKGWSEFPSLVKKLGLGRLLLKLGKGQDGQGGSKRPLTNADAIALLGLDASQASSPHCMAIAACKWFSNDATPSEWSWVEHARPSNTSNTVVEGVEGGDGGAGGAGASVGAAEGARQPSPLPRRASMPIVADKVLADGSNQLARMVGGKEGDEDALDSLWLSFEHPASTKAKSKSLARLAEIMNEHGMSAASSAVKYAYEMATGARASANVTLERPAFQYAIVSAIFLSDLATIMDAASAKIYAADPLISLAEFKEGVASYRLLKDPGLAAACTALDTLQTGVFPYSAVCKWYVGLRVKEWPNVTVPVIRQAGAKVNSKTTSTSTGTGTRTSTSTITTTTTTSVSKRIIKSPAPKRPSGGRTSPARASPKAVPKSNRKPSKQVVALTATSKRKKVLIKKLTPSADTGVHALKETRDEDVAAAEVIKLVLTDPRQVLRLWEDIDNKVDGTATAMDVANIIIKSYPGLKDRLGSNIDSYFESLVKAETGLHPGFISNAVDVPFAVLKMLHYSRLAQCFGLPPPSANTDARIDAKIAHDSLAKLGAHTFLAGKDKAAFHNIPSKEGGDRGTVLLPDFCLWYAEERVRREPKLAEAREAILDELAGKNNQKPKRRFSLFKAKANEVRQEVKLLKAFGGQNAGKEINAYVFT